LFKPFLEEFLSFVYKHLLKTVVIGIKKETTLCHLNDETVLPTWRELILEWVFLVF
jgi:hypothetical protein